MMPVAMAVAMPVAMISLGCGVSGIGYALGARTGAFALFAVFRGVIADRFHPEPQMIGADAVRCLARAPFAATSGSAARPCRRPDAGVRRGGPTRPPIRAARYGG